MIRTRSRQILTTVLMVGAASTALLVSRERDVFGILKSTTLIGRQEGDAYLVATNQLVRAWEQQSPMRGRPIEVAFDSRKKLMAVLNNNAVHLLDGSTGTELARIPSRSTSYTGLAFRPGDREIWASEATRKGPDSILITSLTELGLPQETSRIPFPGHPVPTGIAFSQDGATAYIALSNNNSVAVVDTQTRRVVREVAAGIAPYGIAVSHKRKQIYVSNRGGRRPATQDSTAFSSTSKVITNAETGSTTSGTMSVIDMDTFTGRSIVGLAPAGLALSPDDRTLAIANAHSDSVTFLDLESSRASEVKIPAYPEGTFGSTPSAVTFSPDGKTVYVACGGNNAIGVLGVSDSNQWTLKGAIPVGWYPTALATDRDGNLRVVNVKGFGNTANRTGAHNSREFEGSVWRIPAPKENQLAAGMREVIASNAPRFSPNGGVSDLSKLGIRHVFFIIKENRTYDHVFGDMPKGNGDPKLTMYGRAVTPNHHVLAEQYILFDNFYAGGAISFDGHRVAHAGFRQRLRRAVPDVRSAGLCLEHGRRADSGADRFLLAGPASAPSICGCMARFQNTSNGMQLRITRSISTSRIFCPGLNTGGSTRIMNGAMQSGREAAFPRCRNT